MAGSGNSTTKRCCRKGAAAGGTDTAGEQIPDRVIKGYGTPSFSSPVGTIYVKLDATMGASSHYRCTASTGTWAAMSDD